MMRRRDRERIWHEGFEAAQFPRALCPYSKDSQQADIWESGWAEGVMRRSGAPYRSEPPVIGWRRLLRLVLGQPQ